MSRRGPRWRSTLVSAARPTLINEIALRKAVDAFPTPRPRLSIAVLLTADLVALSTAAATSVIVWSHFGTPFDPQFYVRLWPVLLLFPLAYATSALYPAFGCNPAGELRTLSTVTSVVYAALAVGIFLLKDAETYSRGIFLLAWAQTVALVPLGRALARTAFADRPWWGYPVVVLGSERAAAVATTLEYRGTLGLKPAGVFERLEAAELFAGKHRIRHAILVMEEAHHGAALAQFERASNSFSEVIVVPELAGFSSLWVEARDLNGILGLQVRQRLLGAWPRIVKRTVDVAAVIAGGILALPVAIAIAAAIKINTPGPVFYKQKRIGLGGREFMAWKFRTMVNRANEALEEHLSRDERLRQEWQKFQKLRDDPRITRVGRFLRRTSLDELPQLWNILTGEMSLVGPRPIIRQETSHYGGGLAMYQKVKPGLTGLWQVSGRNHLTYEERVSLDLYYIRNWSPWLDVYILARTAPAVLAARGAY